eukprot:6195998-Pleurochrysis_carterae.AAC.6
MRKRRLVVRVAQALPESLEQRRLPGAAANRKECGAQVGPRLRRCQHARKRLWQRSLRGRQEHLLANGVQQRRRQRRHRLQRKERGRVRLGRLHRALAVSAEERERRKRHAARVDRNEGGNRRRSARLQLRRRRAEIGGSAGDKSHVRTVARLERDERWIGRV